MKKNIFMFVMVAIAFFPLLFVLGCNEEDKGPSAEELLIGSWHRYWNKAYFVLILRANGGWSSDVRIEGAASKIVAKRGNASGTWRVEESHLVITVLESDIEDAWKKDKTLFCEIVEIDKSLMTLKYPNERIIIWKRSKVKQKAGQVELLPPVINLAPLVVNLNKIRSHDKDRYLCLDLELNLYDLRPDQELPKFHPRAREAAVMFLSSLTYKEVKTFDKVKEAKEKLKDLLNPYLDGLIENIKLNHVVISSTIEKVDEFLLEHTPVPEPVVSEDEEEKKEE
ncbi:MAG: flagellar basal body-associated FliL family protein [Thermodesulfobacteriota bacterium]|nr:flagellar basal body-associated FliL family protein [Thermodesulfobacteriota bacterium]